MTKAIIFDSDGMLTHGPRFSDTYAAEHGISLDEMSPFFTGPFKQCLLGKADLKEELQKGWLAKWGWEGTADELLSYWFSVGDVLEQEVLSSITKLREKGIICVLATNQEKYRTDYLSEKFSYDSAFDRVFSSAYVGHKKSSSEFFDVILAYVVELRGPTEKSEIIFWDDDIENVEAAKSYGLDARQFTSAPDYVAQMQKSELL